MLPQVKVRHKIWGMLVLFVIGLLSLSAYDTYSIRNVLISEKKLKTRHLVEAVHSVAGHYAALHQRGVLSLEQAQQTALQLVNDMRYQGADYFWIHDLQQPVPRMVMHPTVPSLNGQILDDPVFNCATSLQFGVDGPVSRTDGQKNLFVAFNEVVNRASDGYVNYLWPKPLLQGGTTEQRYPKLSYVKRFDDWDWVVGSGIYIDDVDQLIHQRLLQESSIIIAFAGGLILLGGLLASNISKRLIRTAKQLRDMTEGNIPQGPLDAGKDDEIGTLINGFNQMQSALLAKEEILLLSASVFENTNEAIVITNTDGLVVNINPSYTRLTGYNKAQVFGKKPSLICSDKHSPEFFQQMRQTLLCEGFWKGEISSRRKSGELFIALLAIKAVRSSDGALSHYVGIFSDITHEKEQQKRLEHMAHFDALTRLPNRVLLSDRLKVALSNIKRSHEIIAIAFIDLDEFKPINDHYGHAAGDQILIEVAHRLQRCTRGGDTVSRLGGDEFVLLLVGLKNPQEVRHTLERILTSLSQPFLLDAVQVSLSASIGVTLSCNDTANSEVMLRHADQAMYEAKQHGRNCYRFFDAEHDRITRIHNQHILEIEQALNNNELLLYYQPKVDLRQGKIIGAEALLRWQHPDKGLLLPGVFLPDIENHELEVAIGDWVIETTLIQLQQWQQQGISIPVSVNVSASQLESQDFVSKLRQALARHPQVERFSLEMEILETTALSDYDHISKVIEECSSLGVSFAIDDFGTGYASLSYVKRLPVNTLKIDKSFVIDILDQPDDQAIVEGVIGFTRAFQREVIAEGVESAEHGALLLHLGCELAQGFGIAKPMPAEELPGWMASFIPDPLWGKSTEAHFSDYPLIRAEITHRRWIENIKALASEQNPSNRKPPPLNPHHCAFGRWLDGPGRDVYGKLPHYDRIDSIHRQVHHLGQEIIAAANAHQQEQAQHYLEELHQSHLALMNELQQLRELGKQQRH